MIEPFASLNPAVNLNGCDLRAILEGEFPFTDPCHPKVNGEGLNESEGVRGDVTVVDDLLGGGGVVGHGGGVGGVVHILAHDRVCEKKVCARFEM